MERVILHCDLNNFYASCECVRDPSLRDKPVAVCGSKEERHGIVLAKNGIAKAFGVATGETIWQAQQKCPDLVIAPTHFDLYVKYSTMVKKIYSDYTDAVESYGMDEVWMDVSGWGVDIKRGEKIANEIRCRVKRETELTISVGVSFNKIFAKLGSDMKKPDAVTVIPRDTFREKIWNLPASELLGVGRATKRELDRYGINTIGKLAAMPEDFMKRHFGKCGVQLLKYANGQDSSPVQKTSISIAQKSFGHGTTTAKDLTTSDDVWRVMLELVQSIGSSLISCKQRASGVSISIKDNALVTKQWQKKLNPPTQSAYMIARAAFELFEKEYSWARDVRSVTVTAIDLVSEDVPMQITLADDPDDEQKREKLERCVDKIRKRFGDTAIMPATILKNNDTNISPVKLLLPTGMV